MQEALDYLRQKLDGFEPELAITLGSGMGSFAETSLKQHAAIDYAEIPGFPTTGVKGHRGRLVAGEACGARIACLQGRVHLYEGWSARETALPVRLMRKLGAGTAILTNAAGGVNEALSPGDIMLIDDHINFTGDNPLVGPNDDSFGPRFPDMTECYDAELRQQAEEAARARSIPLKRGVYIGVRGPSFETPAEVRAFRAWGADAVGMSTVCEAIAARHAGMRVCGLSCISNRAAGIDGGQLSHDEVFEAIRGMEQQLAQTLLALAQAIKGGGD